MKTLEELYQEVLAGEELKKAFSEAVNENRVTEFLKANGCETDAETLEAFLKEKTENQGELADEELDSVAGGCRLTGSKASANELAQSLAEEDPEAKFRLVKCYSVKKNK